MISVRFQDKPFNITVIQVYALTSNAEEAEVEQFYEDLQDLLELTLKKDVLFIMKVKVKSLSCVQLFATPWTRAYQAPPCMDSPGKSTGVGSHFPSPGDLPTQGSTPGLLHSRKTL